MTRPAASSPAVRSVMRGNRGRDTRPELRVRRLVHAAELRYRVNTRPLATSRFTADLVFTKIKLAVFVDGCFWHGCPTHLRPARSNAAFWAAKLSENTARDTRANETLRAAGWTVFRAWEHDDPDEVAQQIQELVERLRRCG